MARTKKSKWKPGRDGLPDLAFARKRHRDLTRLLNNNDKLPADVRRDHERELDACAQMLAEKQQKNAKSDLIGRYHMVRFFERQKATRLLKKVKSALRATDDPKERARIDPYVHRAEVDLNYALYFPLSQPYVSIYADEKNKKQPDSMAGPTRRSHPTWSLVEKRMAQGDVESLRDEGWEEVEAKSKPSTSLEVKAKSKAGKIDRPITEAENNVQLTGRKQRRAAERQAKADACHAHEADSEDDERGMAFFGQ